MKNSETKTTKPGTYNAEDAGCLCFCAACDKELTGTHSGGKKAHWLATDAATGAVTRRHADRDGSAGLARWRPYGSGCAKRVLKGQG